MHPKSRFSKPIFATPRGQLNWTGPIANGSETLTFLSQTFRARPGYPTKNPGISCQKVWFSGFRRTYRTFWAPTPSSGRPPPHPKMSGPKSLGLSSFVMPEEIQECSYEPMGSDVVRELARGPAMMFQIGLIGEVLIHC